MILAGEAVTVLSRVVSGQDGDGNDVFTDSPRVVDGCIWNPGVSVELTQGQDLLTVKPTIYMPAGSVVSARDRLVVRGVTYEVDGAASTWVSPFTRWTPGVEVHVRAVTG